MNVVLGHDQGEIGVAICTTNLFGEFLKFLQSEIGIRTVVLDGVLLELVVGRVFFAVDAVMSISHRELTPSDRGISLLRFSTFLEVTNARSTWCRD